MSDLTDDDLVAIADGISGASRAEYAGMASELLNLRAVVAAHPTGPDQDQPAAYMVVGPRLREPGVHLAREDAEDAVRRGHGERSLVPLYRHRAREAQATAPAADEASTRFRPGDFVTVADGATVGEYVSYEGGPFHRHRYRLVWPDGTRAPEVSAADDPRVSPAAPGVLAEYALTQAVERGDR